MWMKKAYDIVNAVCGDKLIFQTNVCSFFSGAAARAIIFVFAMYIVYNNNNSVAERIYTFQSCVVVVLLFFFIHLFFSILWGYLAFANFSIFFFYLMRILFFLLFALRSIFLLFFGSLPFAAVFYLPNLNATFRALILLSFS